MTPADAVGSCTPPITTTLDRGRLRLFAKATSQRDPVYTDLKAARAAGHRDLLVPPTFLFGVELERDEPFDWYLDLGYSMNQMLHGTQAFEYLAAVYAGDEVTAVGTITDIQIKKGGRITTIERQTRITRDGEDVALLTGVAIVRSAT